MAAMEIGTHSFLLVPDIEAEALVADLHQPPKLMFCEPHL